MKKVLAKIKEFFEQILFGANSRTLEAGIVRKCGADVADGLLSQYEKTFMAALEGNALGEFEQGGVRFADKNEWFEEDKYYARQIDKFETLKQGGYITVGVVAKGSPLNQVGIPYGKLYFDVSKITQEMKGRGDVIPPEKMKEIPKVLGNPIVITEYVDKNGMHSANVYGNLYVGSSPVVIGVMITQTQKGNVVSKVQTVHPNRNAIKEMTDDNILYLSENKKETKLWFQSLGTQVLPLGGNKFGLIRSISQSDGFVKKNGKEIFGNDTTGLKSDPEDDVDYVDYDKPITIRDVDILRSIGRKSINAFTSEDIKKARKWAYKFYKELGVKSPFFRAWFGDWRALDNSRVAYVPVNAQSIERSAIPRGDFYNEDTKWMIRSNADGIDETSSKEHKWSDNYHALSDIDKMLKNAVLLDSVVVTEPSKRLGKNAAFMHHMYCPVVVDGKKGIAKLYVAESLGNEHKFYLLRIEKTSADMGLDFQEEGSTLRSKTTSADGTISIAEIFEFVKSHNMDFEANSEYPVQFLPKPVNKALLNKDGMPKVFYHGTNADFTQFDPRKQGSATGSHFYGKGFYFSTSEEDARRYGSNVMRVYLRAEKVLDLDKDEWARELGIESDSPRVEVDRISLEDLGNGFVNIHYTTKADQNTWHTIDQVSQMRFNSDEGGVRGFLERRLNQGKQILPRDVKNLAALARAKGYDAIIGDGTNIGDVGREIVVFKSEQIKSATDNIGTFDGGNDNILRSDPEDDVKSDREILAGALMSVAQNEIERNALKVYQGYAKKLDEMNARLREVNAEIRTMMFQRGARDEAYNQRLDALKAQSPSPAEIVHASVDPPIPRLHCRSP